MLGLLLRYWGYHCVWFWTIVHPTTITKKGKWQIDLEIHRASNLHSLNNWPRPLCLASALQLGTSVWHKYEVWHGHHFPLPGLRMHFEVKRWIQVLQWSPEARTLSSSPHSSLCGQTCWLQVSGLLHSSVSDPTGLRTLPHFILGTCPAVTRIILALSWQLDV